ncbi:MAG: proton-conducting transporter transmembrane domain-containing protein [Thermoleophilia bacterium]
MMATSAAQVFIVITGFFALCGAGVLLSLIAPRQRQGSVLAVAGCLAAAALILAGSATLILGENFRQPLWSLPNLGTMTISLDQLSAVFLLVTGLVLFPASIFAGSQLKRRSSPTGRVFTVLLLALYAAIGLIFISGDAFLFLLAWEAMSIFSYLLIVFFRKQNDDASGAGYLFLAMGEAGTLAAVLGFLLLGVNAGSLDFAAIHAAAPGFGPGVRWAVFLLSFFGFGVKAGLAPVNFWLPRAYAAASRAFVPVLAGATLNLGLYGILRVNAGLMPATSAGPGLIALIAGTITALVGILYATTENDLKVILAHSSIENVGIVVAGFGAGMIFVGTDHPVPAAIAFVAALYHLVNHSLFKTLLFIGAGEVESQTGTRDLNKLGGLIKWMPMASLAFLVGTLSISALPPLNGFVSEWLILQTMLRSAELSSAGVKLAFSLAGAGLALTAALAVTCFVKVFAMGFLGMRRRDENPQVVEAKSGTLVPMFLLGALCLGLGLLPTYVIPALGPAVRPLAGASATDALVPPFFASSPAHNTLPPAFVQDFQSLGAQVGQNLLPGRGLVVLHRGGAKNPVIFAMSPFYMAIILVILLLATYVVIRIWLTRGRSLARRKRWDGGVRRLLPEMTYTATGFSNPVRVIFDAVFRPTAVADTSESVTRHFRTAIRRERERTYLVDRLVFYPVRAVLMRIARALARLHQGRLNTYAAYVLAALLLMLLGFLVFQSSW